MTDTENQMNAVERMYEYRDGIQLEAASVVEENRPDPTWPQQGTIQISGLSMRYREGLRLVLEDVRGLRCFRLVPAFAGPTIDAVHISC